MPLFIRQNQNRVNGLQGGDIWNGVPGSGVTHAICDGCASVDDALQALEELAEKHPKQ